MDRSRTIIWVVGVFAILALLLWVGNRQKNDWNWYSSYVIDSDEPYGFSMLYSMLGTWTDQLEFIEEGVQNFDFPPGPSSYFYAGYQPSLDSTDIDSLLAYVSRGNTAFIAAQQWPDTLHWKLGGVQWPGYYHLEPEAKIVYLNFLEQPFQMKESHRVYRKLYNKKRSRTWFFVDTAELKWNFPGTKVLGMEDTSGANMFSVNYGDGQLCFFTTPIALTNYFLIQPDGRDYAERVLTFLQEGPIYWDNRQSNFSGAGREPQVSPLRYIISQPALRWAWYIMLTGGLLYILFRTRRRQSSIPLIDPKENSSLEYVETVSNLHYAEQKDHRPVAEMLSQQFYTFLRERYHISTSRTDDAFIKLLVVKSGVEEEKIKEIVKHLQYLDTDRPVSAYELLRMHRHVQDFYEHPEVSHVKHSMEQKESAEV